MDKKLEVALTKEMCPVCCKEQNGQIIMNTKLTKDEAEKIKKLHNKVVGWSEKPCKNCIDDFKEQEGYYLVGIIPEKSGNSIEEMYRSGRLIGLTKEGIDKFLENIYSHEKTKYEKFLRQHGFLFVDDEILKLFSKK